MGSTRKKKQSRVPRMTEAELRKFVDDLVSDRVFVSTFVGKNIDLLTSIFLPVGLGGLSKYTKAELNEVGVIYEHYEKRMPMAVNGFPTFVSCRLMHREDWLIVRKAAAAEFERRKSIPL